MHCLVLALCNNCFWQVDITGLADIVMDCFEVLVAPVCLDGPGNQMSSSRRLDYMYAFLVFPMLHRLCLVLALYNNSCGRWTSLVLRTLSGMDVDVCCHYSHTFP